ncbi:MAG: hypothetical protein R3D25_04970 [Geminicoccaceae bacterium]
MLPPNPVTLIAEMADSADHLGRSLIRLWLGSAGRSAGLLPDRRVG